MILACESREYTNDIYMFLSCTQGTPGIMVATMPGLSPASHLTTLSAAGLGAQAQFCGTHLRLWDSTLTYFLSTVDQRDFLSFISSLSLPLQQTYRSLCVFVYHLILNCNKTKLIRYNWRVFEWDMPLHCII